MEQILKSRYRIAEKISENPFSLTYRGFLIGTDKPVIIKIYKRGTLSAPLIKSMKQKVRDFSLLTHQGIAKLLDGDYGWQGFYYVREYIEGESLQALMMKKGKVGWERAEEIIDQALEVLKIVHGKKIIHAALKPSNIFVDSQGLVRLTDFVIEGEVKESMPYKVLEVVFNDKYASPEELAGSRLLPNSDLYSLGLIFYELATGKAAFKEEGINCNINKLNSNTIFSKEEMSSLPRYVAEIIAKAVSRDPIERFASAEEFGESLKRKGLFTKSARNEGLLKIFESVVTQYGGEEAEKDMDLPLEIGNIQWSKEKHRNWILAIAVGVAVALGLLYAFFFGV